MLIWYDSLFCVDYIRTSSYQTCQIRLLFQMYSLKVFMRSASVQFEVLVIFLCSQYIWVIVFQVLSISLAALGSLMWLRKNKPKTLIPIIYACAGIVATMPSITRYSRLLHFKIRVHIFILENSSFSLLTSVNVVEWFTWFFAVIWNWAWDGTSRRW